MTLVRKQVVFQPVDVVIASGTRSLNDVVQGEKGEISPLAFAGGLRAALWPAAENSGKKDALGIDTQNPDEPNGFRFIGPFLSDPTGQLWFPLPRHILVAPDEIPRYTLLTPETDDGYASDAPLASCSVLTTESRQAEVASEWLTLPNLLKVLKTGSQWFIGEPREKWVREEPRTGHHRTQAGTVADEGGLYSRTALRFKEEVRPQGLAGAAYAGFVEICRDLDRALDTLKWVRLGGDGHMAACRVHNGTPAILDSINGDFANAIFHSKRMILYLATPAIFKEGWQPDWSRLPDLHNWALKAAAVGRPIPIAGWDYSKGGPRPVYRAVPPGSVYFLEAPDGLDLCKVKKIVEKFTLSESVSDHYGRLGFGFTLVGVWYDQKSGPAKEGGAHATPASGKEDCL